MVATSQWAKRFRLVGIVALFGILAGFVLWSGNGKDGRPALGQKAGGDARLLSFQPYPEMDGPMCEMELVPASATTSLMATLLQEQSTLRTAQGVAEPRPSDAVKEAAAKRAPVRTIRNSHPVFSAVALNLATDEVVIQDENTYGIMIFDRTTNTPPTARMSEPKRWIRGEDTQLEYNCSLYIDPVNGDIYSVNNDTKNMLMVFSRDANGNVKPKKLLKTPYYYGIAMDEERQEMFLSAQGGIVAVWKKSASGDDLPLRYIRGNNTRLADPHGIALDAKTGLLYVSNWGTSTTLETPYATPNGIPWGDGRGWGMRVGRRLVGMGKIEPAAITVYRKDAIGDAAPVQVIQGSQTQLNWPVSIAIDSEHGEIYVANEGTDSIAVYPADANGNVAPLRVIKGPKSMIKNPAGVAYDPMHEELWVANYGNHTATVYPRTADGDTPPIRMIRSAPIGTPQPMMGNPHVLVYVDKREELLVGQ